jgi:DNA repair protein SbcC/Rad50
MIPLQLSLKNFLSYGPEMQTIYFEPYHFICLSGKNGHGKSALLDAMTWATWGQARKPSGSTRLEEYLLHLSTTDMLVTFEFAASGKMYRIKRGFIKQGAKGTASLEFGIIDQNKQVLSLTGKTIRETQRTIIKEIGLDFETFLNSSFLRQGDANEFSKKTPKERKDLLGRILSLEYYESIKKIAHEKIKEYTAAKESLLSHQKTLLTKKEEFVFLDSAISVNQEKRTDLENRIQKTQQQLTTITTLHTQTIQDCWIVKKTQEVKQKLTQQQEKYRDILHALRKERKLVRQTKQKQQSIKPLLAKKEVLLQHIFAQQQYLQEKITYEQELLKTKQALMVIIKNHEQENQTKQEPILQQQRTIETEKKATSFQIEQLTKEINTSVSILKTTQQQIQQVTHELTRHIKQEQDAYLLVQRFQKRSTLYQHLAQKYKEVTKLVQELEIQQELLEKKDKTCPLCLSSLSPHTKETVITTLHAKKEELLEKKCNIHALIEKVKQYLEKESNRKTQCQQLAAAKETKKELLFQVISRKEQLDASIKKNQEIITNLQTRYTYLTHQEKLVDEKMKIVVIPVEQNTEYQQLSTHISHLEYTKQSCCYNETTHKKYKQELDQLCLQIQTIEQEDCDTKLKHINEHLYQTCSFLRQIQKQLAENEYHHEKYDALHKKIVLIEMTIKSHQETLQTLTVEKDVLLQEQGRLVSDKKQQQETLITITQQQETIKKIQKDIDYYNIIMHTMGKDGIQALLVEQAIPEIEYEANAILSRLSQNEMHIFIESVKDLKSGKTKETLDITISDSKGVRPYELFSGGEAFRIDLSLRIALSKLLAHRAGTVVETLIIDEGFGSQDQEGISMVIDALYKIQSDFKKIIIVSHLPHFKEQIPVHFTITKTALGSSVMITNA